MRKKILLTGGTGFVGKQIFKHLLNCNVDITLVTRSGTKYAFDEIDNIVSIIETNDLFKETSSWWASVTSDIDIVINAAWFAEPGSYYTSLKNIDCVRGSLNLAEGCISSGVKKFVGIGTCAEYEISNEPIPYNGSLKPLSIYAASKLATFQMLQQLFDYSDISFAWCRLFYLFGDGEDERRLVPYIKKNIIQGDKVELSSGNQVRDFIDVAVAGNIIANISLSDQRGPINVCSGIPKTIREHSIEIAKKLDGENLLNFGGRNDNPLEPQYIVGVPNWDQNK